MTVDVGSPDVSRNSRQSEVTTHAGSPDAQSLSLRSDCGRRKSRSPDVSRNSRQSEVPTQAGSPGIDGSTDLLTVLVGSPDVRRKFRRWLSRVDFNLA